MTGLALQGISHINNKVTHVSSTWHAGKQITYLIFFSKCFIIIIVILKLLLFIFLNELFIKLTNPRQFLHEPQFGETLT